METKDVVLEIRKLILLKLQNIWNEISITNRIITVGVKRV